MLASCSRNALKANQILLETRSVSAVKPAPSLHSFVNHQCRHASQFSANTAKRPGEGGPLPPLIRPTRNGPYDFPIHNPLRNAPRGSDLARANLQLGRLVDQRKTTEVFETCLKMKAAGTKPNLVTYDQLLRVCADHRATTEAWAVFEDMLCMGIRPERESFHHVIIASSSREMRETWRILDMMATYDISPNQTTYEIVILRLLESQNLELSLQYLAEMNKNGLTPSLKTVQGIIRTACALGYPRLALELADAFESTSVRRIENEVWLDCLGSAAEHLYAEGVTRAWVRVVQELDLYPDEGSCLHVLNTAARHGLSDLGMDVIRVLGDIKVTWEEHHFAPLVEAFCRENNLKDAFMILDLMRSYGIAPVSETAIPIYKAIGADHDKVDEAWGILEAMHEDGKTVDVTALNVIVLASVAHGDLQRAIGTYKAFSELEVTPSVDTFNYLLSGCITAGHRELGDRLLSEMREQGIKPDAQTYERMVVLSLTQATYEDAFFYLEEMKAAGHLPPQPVYEAIVRKCVSMGDTRFRIALEEMEEKGYVMTQRLKAFVESGGEHDKFQERRNDSKPSSRIAKRKQQDFVDV